MVTASWFVTALEARNNIVKDIAVHGEICAIEMQVLRAVQRGDYEVTVSGNTPMTELGNTVSHVFSVDSVTNTLLVPNHGFSTGDIVTVSSTAQLPPPLTNSAFYYVIYVDQDHIKLAATKADAVAGMAIPIDIDQGVVSVGLNLEGSGYLTPPTVSFTGGNPDQSASARAVLQSFGSVSDVSLLTSSGGFVSTPLVSVSAAGTGALAGVPSFKVVSAAVSFGGSNYNINDLLFLITGVGTTAVFRVTSVNGGSVTGISIVDAGLYTDLPVLSGSNTSTGGFGGGCSINLTMGLAAVAVATGGLNYVNPPLVSISGGGGNGAAVSAQLVGGVVNSFVVTSSGSGYTDPSSMVISVSAGSGATAVAQLSPTSVNSIVLTNAGGDDYLDPPSVNLVVSGFGASSTSVLMKTVSATLRNAGVAYAQGDQLLVSGGAGTSNTVIQVLTVNSSGSILSYNIISPGLYSSLPTLVSNNVYGGQGSGASFDLSMGVSQVNMTTAGSGYVLPPSVLFSGGNPQTPASAISNLVSDTVGSVSVLDPGSGYTSVPTVDFSLGSGATAVANLVPSSVDQVVILNPGSGYSVPPIVVISGGGGQGATAEATIDGSGSIDNIFLTNPGSGYTSNPSIAIFGDGIGATAGISRFLTPISSIDLIDGGENYTVTPSVVIGGGGSASARAVMNSTGLSAVRITASGSLYTADPILLFENGLDQIDAPLYPVCRVNRQFSVRQIVVTNSGSGYQSAPQVQMSAPQVVGGVTATGTAVLGVGSGVFTIRRYTSSLDYFKVMNCGTSGSSGTSNSLVDRPYSDQMNAVIKYFTDLGYTITRTVNPATGNTFMWVIKW